MMDDVFKPGWCAKKETYISSDYHQLIGIEDRPDVFSLKNIGDNGSNLTIAVLSMNRSSLTIRLLESLQQRIPDYAGKVLIGDNGSTAEEIDKIERYLQKSFLDGKVLRFGQNYGVAGGRNRLFREVETDWLMSLDNDLIFTSNPLPQAQKDINRLGVHFLCMPLLDAGTSNSGIYGGHLYLEPLEGRPSIGIGTACTFTQAPCDVPLDGFLCSGIPGGSAIMNKHTFLAVGGFEDHMFIGFEDTEFSVRLFQKGMKIGTCGMFSLVHDHPKPQNQDDKQYEKARFSNQKLLESALYFEKKHGFLVWNESVAKWVAKRQQDTQGQVEAIGADEKVRIALVIDRPDWALDHVANQVIKNLSDEFDFVRIYGSDIDNFTDVLILAKDCQIIHVMWRGQMSSFNDPWCQQRIANLGMTREEFDEKYVKGKVISTEVYDHLLLEGDEKELTLKLFANEDSIVTNYAVSSKKLWALYQGLPYLRLRPSCILSDGVDLDLFKPANLERFDGIGTRTIRFGWVGNSQWSVADLKGINTIIRPAVDQLKEEGYDIDLITSDRQQQMIPYHQMPAFYVGIDCYLCASICEGTPNPVLESMACGIPVISTDVGLVPEVFGKTQRDFILEERSIECMKEKMKMLLIQPALFQKLSAENQQSIQSWDWKIMTQAFRLYFNDVNRQRVD